ncbi:MAG: PAS domain S-box protein, partial [Bacteroidota bacterium]
ILVADKDSRIIMSNLRAAEIFGYSSQEMLGMDLAKVIPQSKRHQHQHSVKKYWDTPQSRPKHQLSNLKGLKASGEEISLDISLNPVQIVSGTYVVAHIVDQSEKGELQSNLISKKNLLEALVEYAVDGIITINSRGIIETLNPAAAKLFGYEPAEIVGENISKLMPEPHQSSHDAYINHYHKTGEAKIIGIGREVEGRKKDGSLFPFYLSVSKVETTEGHFFAGIVHDLSEQKAAENELRQYSIDLEQRVEARTSALAEAIQGLKKEIQERSLAEEALRLSEAETQEALMKERELNELKSRFVSMASHEFRTPLATILSSMNLLERYQEQGFSEKQDKHIQRIKSNVKHLTDVLNDFLSLSKLEEGRVQVVPQKVDIVSLIQEFKEDIETQLKEGQRILYQHEEKVQEILLDPKLLHNILINLLSNAVKYSPEHSQIELKSVLEDEHLFIEVKDQGMGIPQDEIHHMFERFFRARNSSHIQGTGLGLSIVKLHVEMMGGMIEVKSGLNEGTVFSLTFPRNIYTHE